MTTAIEYRRRTKAAGMAMRFDYPVLDRCERQGDCLVWTGATTYGYGVFGLLGWSARAHRVVYEQRHGPLAPGLQVHHTCGNRACCNIDHLEALSFGEHRVAHGRPHLSTEQVREIKKQVAAGSSHRVVARAFGTTRQNISHIVNGRTRKNG